MVAQIKKKMSGARKKDLIFYSLILFIPMFNFTFLVAYVKYFDVFMFAMKEFDFDSGTFVWAEDLLINVKTFFRYFKYEEGWAKAAVVSLKNYLVGYLTMPISFFVPWYIVKKQLGSRIFKFILMLPGIINSIVWTFLYMNFMEKGLPAIFDMPMGPFSNPNTQWIAMQGKGVWLGFASSMLLYVGMFGSVAEEVVEAGKLDGMGPIRELIHLYLPTVYELWAIGIATSLMGIFTADGGCYEMFGFSANGQVATVGYKLFCSVLSPEASLADYPINTAASVVITFIFLPIVLIIRWLLLRIGPTEEERQPVQWFWKKFRRNG